MATDLRIMVRKDSTGVLELLITFDALKDILYRENAVIAEADVPGLLEALGNQAMEYGITAHQHHTAWLERCDALKEESDE